MSEKVITREDDGDFTKITIVTTETIYEPKSIAIKAGIMSLFIGVILLMVLAIVKWSKRERI